MHAPSIIDYFLQWLLLINKKGSCLINLINNWPHCIGPCIMDVLIYESPSNLSLVAYKFKRKQEVIQGIFDNQQLNNSL